MTTKNFNKKTMNKNYENFKTGTFCKLAFLVRRMYADCMTTVSGLYENCMPTVWGLYEDCMSNVSEMYT